MSRRSVESDYEQGKSDAWTQMVPNPVTRSREGHWAYDAGWRDGIRNLEVLKRKLDAIEERRAV